MGTITLKDKNGVQLGPIKTDNDGYFTFDVKGLAFPFVLKADWITTSQSYTLYSVVTGAGTANINPLTNLLLQIATNSDPAVIFGGQGAKPDTSLISNSTIMAAQDKINTLLAPLFTKYGISDINPLYGTYTATPENKLDAMLDVISVKVEDGMLSINNKLDGSTIASGKLTNVIDISLDMAKSPDNAMLMDIKEITQRLDTLRSTLNRGEVLTITDTDALFFSNQNYGNSNGHTRAEDMASIVAIFGPGGTNSNGKLKSIRNVRLVSDRTENYSGRDVAKAYLLNYDFIFNNGTMIKGNNVTFGKELSRGQWKFIGDPAGSNIGNNSGLIFTSDTISLPPAPLPKTDFSGVWVGSYSTSSSVEYPTTLYFQQNQDGTANGYMASNKFSGDFEYCQATDMTISCIVRSMDWRNSANLVITKTNKGISIDSFSTGRIFGSEVYSGTGTATRFDLSTETGLRGVWTGTAMGPDGQSNQKSVVMMVADNVAGASSKYVGGVFTTIRYATGGFVMNADPWLLSIWGYDNWYGQGSVITTGNPVSALGFSIGNNINYKPINTYVISLNRIP
jgi:hypothetical protein